jgi:hypothetical protein
MLAAELMELDNVIIEVVVGRVKVVAAFFSTLSHMFFCLCV